MPIIGARGGASSIGFGQFTGALAPTQPVAGYHLWLDAANAASFTYSSGSVVSQWTDRSANAFTFTTAGTTNQPSRTGSQNSKSTVVFDGTNDYLKSTAAASTWKYLHDGTQTTMFIVMKSNEPYPGTSGVNWIMSTQTSGPGFNFYIDVDTSPASLKLEIDATSSAFILNVKNLSSNYNIYTYKLDANNSTNVDKIKDYTNTTAGTYGATVTGGYSPSSSDPGSSLYLGTGYNGTFTGGSYPQYMFAGEIAEILTYKSLLSDSDRNANVSYLKSKWGI